MCELAEMLEFADVKREIESEKSLERWAKRYTNSFTKNGVWRNRQRDLEWDRGKSHPMVSTKQSI